MAAYNCTKFRSVSVTTKASVRTTPGDIYGWYMFNAAASVRYVKLYDAALGDVTVGTTVPAMTIPIPPGQAANAAFPNPWPFSTAIVIAAVTGVADNDSTPASANDVIVNLLHKE